MGMVDLHFTQELSCLYEFVLPEMYGNGRSALYSGTIVFVCIYTVGARVAAMVPYGKPKISVGLGRHKKFIYFRSHRKTSS